MHTAPSTGVFFDANGSLLSCGYDGRVIAWNATRSEPLWVAHHDGLANNVTTDGSQVASVGADRRLRRWRREDGTPLGHALFESVDDLNVVHILPSGDLVVAGDEGKIILVDSESATARWERASALPHTYGESIEALCIAHLNDDHCIFFGNGSGDIGFMNLQGEILISAQVTGTIECCAICQSSNLIYLGMSDGSVCALTADNLVIRTRTPLHGTTVKAIAVSLAGRVATSSYDGQLLICDANLNEVRRFNLGDPLVRGWARSLAFNPLDADELAITTLADRPAVIDIGRMAIRSSYSELTHGINCLGVRHGRVIAGADDGYLWAISATSATRLHDVGSMILCLAIHPESYIVALGTHDGSIFIIDITSGVRLATIKESDVPVVSIIFGRGGTELLAGDYRGHIRVFSANTWIQVREITFADSIKSMCWIADGSRVAVAVADGSVSVWEQATATVVAANMNAFLPNAVGWSAANSLLISVSRDLLIRSWSVDLQLRSAVAAHRRSIKALAMTSDGRKWATSGYDSLICIWSNGELLAECKGHQWPGVAALCWLDSHVLVSGGWDSTIRYWTSSGKELAQVDLRQSACSLRSARKGNAAISVDFDKV